MDAASIAVLASVVTAVVMIVPGVIASYVQRQREAEQSRLDKAKEDNQSRKDEAQAQIDLSKETREAALTMLQPLRDEVARLQARGIELETALIEKTTENGKLRQENITKDTELLQYKYKVEKLQMKLNAYLPELQTDNFVKPILKKKEDTIPRALVVEMKALEVKSNQIAEETNRQLEELKSKSLINGNSSSFQPNGIGE